MRMELLSVEEEREKGEAVDVFFPVRESFSFSLWCRSELLSICTFSWSFKLVSATTLGEIANENAAHGDLFFAIRRCLLTVEFSSSSIFAICMTLPRLTKEEEVAEATAMICHLEMKREKEICCLFRSDPNTSAGRGSSDEGCVPAITIAVPRFASVARRDRFSRWEWTSQSSYFMSSSWSSI